MFEIKTPVYTWGFSEEKLRHYVVVTLPFEEARKRFKPRRFSAINGDGEQRETFERHANLLKRAMLDGTFSPASATVSLTNEQRDKLVFEDIESEAFEGRPSRYVKITVDDEDTLPLIDAGHRMAALESIYGAGNDAALRQPVTAIIYLNGNRKLDFINLQSGRAVDKAHMTSLTIQENAVNEKLSTSLTFALEAAKILHSDVNSPFYKQMKFDSSGTAAIPVSSLMSKGASDLATSLVGAAKICEFGKKSSEWYAKVLIKTFDILKSKCSIVIATGRPLCPPPEGKKGGATMVVGVANMMAYRLMTLNKDEPNNEDIDKFVDAIKKNFNVAVSGNFSAARKRELMGDFVKWFLSDVTEPLHNDIPIRLMKLLSTSTLSIKGKLPKQEGEAGPAPKKRTRKKSSDAPEPGEEKKKPGRKPKAKVNNGPAIAPDGIDIDSDEDSGQKQFDFGEIINKVEKIRGAVIEEETLPNGQPVGDFDMDNEKAPWDE